VGKKNKLSKSSLHWFIRSRPYVLLAELRRRFDLDGSEEVRAIQTPEGKTYVGLPERAARLLEELVRERRIGLEYVVDLHARLAIGVFAYDLLKTPVAPHPLRIGAPRFNGAIQNGEPDESADEAPDDEEVPSRPAPEPRPPPARTRPWAPRSGPAGEPRSPEPRFGGRRPEAPRREERPDRGERPSAEGQPRSGPGGQEQRRRRRGGKRGSDRPETRSGKQP
jgi:hypothetical protein